VSLVYKLANDNVQLKTENFPEMIFNIKAN